MNKWTIVLLVSFVSGLAYGQSSSLYLPKEAPRAEPQPGPDGRIDRLSPTLSMASFSAVPLPAPRKFQLHDLITIIIRESVENNSRSEMETSKETTVEGEITDFPKFQLSDLLDLKVRAGDDSRPNPKVGVEFETEFEGEGSQRRVDTFTTRITARIIDIKPNGTLVLEARKTLTTDSEITQIVMTGTCRKDDVTADNTILSTQLYDLHLDKQSSGELRKATKKGILTRVLEGIFNF